MKPTHVLDNDKESLKALKRALRLSSEAEVISYLMSYYDDTWTKITVFADIQYRDQVESKKNQGVIL